MPGGLHPPQSVIDTWPTPNYINPVTRGYGLLALTVILFIVTPSIVGARLWARIIILRKPGLDDVLICFALIPTIGLGVCFILAAQKFGFDRHIWDVPPTLWLPAAIVGWTIELLYHISTSFIKISILLFYKRMTNATHTIKFMRAVHIALAFQVVWFVLFTIVLCLACQPLDAYWKRLSITGYTQRHKCTQEGIYWPLSVAISIVTDFIATLLPFWLFWHLNLPIRQKVSLYGIFCLGFLTCVAGVFRFVYVIRELNFTYDVFWEGYLLWIVSAVEVNGAIICASAPALKPLFDKFFADIPTSIYVRSVKELSWRAGKNRNGSNGRDTPGLSNPNRDSKTMHARANPRISKAESTHELLNVASGQGPPHWPLK